MNLSNRFNRVDFRDIFGHYFQEKSQENIKDNKESRLKSVGIQGFTEFAKNRNKYGDFFKSRHSDQSLKSLIYNGFSDFLLPEIDLNFTSKTLISTIFLPLFYHFSAISLPICI